MDPELCRVIEQSCFRLFNLEVPLTDSKNPILKEGPCLAAPLNTVNGFRALNVDLMALAYSPFTQRTKDHR